ncbi:hypothetical protein BDV93DRAFT_515886 [Ceratobasidium sp. AG-I]|nr:hypothetical protein BDV93DRAFT_515886 [Ceratobasidium sp. AG-I]
MRQCVSTPATGPQPLPIVPACSQILPAPPPPFVQPTTDPTPPPLPHPPTSEPGDTQHDMYGSDSLFPPSETPPSPPPGPAYPFNPEPGAFQVYDREIDPHLAWIVARGRHAWAPHSDSSLREAAYNVASVEDKAPGLLEGLASLLFPGGIENNESAVDPAGLDVILDFVHGWFDVLTDAY